TGLLIGIGVRHGGSVHNRPKPVDGPGLEQQRLVQGRLATTAVADERHVADAIRGLVHALLLSLAALVRRKAKIPGCKRRGLGHRMRMREAPIPVPRPAWSADAARPWCAAGRRATR